MRVRLQWKWMLLASVLFILFLLIQAYFFYTLKTSWTLSSLLAFCFVMPFLFLLVRSLFKPIVTMTRKARELVSGRLEPGTTFHADDELEDLSKTIAEISTQLRKKMDEVAREKDYHQAILGGMAEGLLLVDGRGRILLVNEALQRLLAISSKVTDKTTLEIIRNVELVEAIQGALHEATDKAFEISLPSTRGRTFEVNVVGIPSSSDEMDQREPKRKGVIAVFHDITRLKDLERIRQDFVANVSHELRTPLTTIKGYVETLLEGAWKEEISFQFLQVIKRHSDRLAKIVEDLLTLSKIESPGFQLKIEEIALRELIADAIDFVKEGAEKKRISIITRDASSSLAVQGDRTYLEQVLINLLENGIKYTPEGGKIEIVTSQKNEQDIQCSIQDTGIGIPEEDLSRIFERFYRVEKGRSQEQGGTGLGLSIVKHIVQAHGGKAWAESQLGKGSTFYFTLPKYSDSMKKESIKDP
ncbi:MAG TPA: ATP-binding protein [Thermodesulfobacteriota bacterium]|nr:ATP-binding protein [Thermodesulfobacteriota bacterium]